jgi:hypothetical protein
VFGAGAAGQPYVFDSCIFLDNEAGGDGGKKRRDGYTHLNPNHYANRFDCSNQQIDSLIGLLTHFPRSHLESFSKRRVSITIIYGSGQIEAVLAALIKIKPILIPSSPFLFFSFFCLQAFYFEHLLLQQHG